MTFQCYDLKNPILARLSGEKIPNAGDVYLVGGAVRGIVTGRPLKDLDFVVSGDARSFSEAMAKLHRSHVVVLGKGKSILYRLPVPEGWLDICPMNASNIRENLFQRDFTINAMALHIRTGGLIDPFEGRSDIERKRIRMVSPQAFPNDPIRILRGVRFAAELDFSIEPETLSSMQRFSGMLLSTAGERIRDELLTLLKSAESHPWIRVMMESGLLFVLFPELKPLAGCNQNHHHAHDVLTHTLKVYEVLEDAIRRCPAIFTLHAEQFISLRNQTDAALLKMASLLHDIGKPQTRTVDASGEVHFHGHEESGADAATDRLRCLRFPEHQIARVRMVIRNHLTPLFLYKARKKGHPSRKGETRFFIRCGDRVPDILLHSLADASGKGIAGPDEGFGGYLSALLDRYARSFEPIRKTPPLITGHDLMHIFGLSPGPIFRTLLSQVRERQLSGDIATRDAAINWISRQCNDLGAPLTVTSPDGSN